MVDYRTENIRCILCNKQLNFTMQNNQELFVCSECQAYFCPQCLHEIRNYQECPAAQLLGVSAHELKLIKILPPKSILNAPKDQEKKTIKIIKEKTVKIIDEKQAPKKGKKKN